MLIQVRCAAVARTHAGICDAELGSCWCDGPKGYVPPPPGSPPGTPPVRRARPILYEEFQLKEVRGGAGSTAACTCAGVRLFWAPRWRQGGRGQRLNPVVARSSLRRAADSGTCSACCVCCVCGAGQARQPTRVWRDAVLAGPVRPAGLVRGGRARDEPGDPLHVGRPAGALLRRGGGELLRQPVLGARRVPPGLLLLRQG